MLLDLKLAFRFLRRAPVLYSVAIGVLGLGIGANAAVYSLFRGFAVRTLPVSHPESIFRLRGGETSPSGMTVLSQRMSVPDYRDIRAQLTIVRQLAAFIPATVRLGAADVEREIDAAFVSGNYFSTLNVNPERGRLLQDDDDRRNESSPIVVISERFWHSEFGGRSDIVGTSLVLNDRQFLIIGVMPASFVGTASGPAVRLWLPMNTYDALANERGLLDARDLRIALVFGRLPPGVLLSKVQAAVSSIAQEISRANLTYHQKFQVEVSDGSRLMSAQDAAQALRVLALVWVLLLIIHMIACSNVASLLLARAVARRQEMAIRLALGAKRAQIIRQLLVESALVAAMSVILGVAVALLIVARIQSLPLLSTFDFHIDFAVLAVAVLAGVATTMLFGLVPALEGARTDIMGTVKGSSGQQGGKGPRSAFGFVAAQLILSVMLLTLTAAAVRGVDHAANANPGYDIEHLLFINVALPGDGKFDPANYGASFDVLRSGLIQVPGVRAVAAAQDIPLSVTQMRDVTLVPDYTYASQEDHHIGFDNVSPGFFRAMGIPILRGSDFDASGYSANWATATSVVIVNDAFANHFWPKQDPIGRDILLKGRYHARVIGVVRDTRDRSLFSDPEPRYFISEAQSNFTLIVTTDVATPSIVAAIRQRINGLGLGVTRPTIALGKDIRAQSLQVAKTTSLSLKALAVLSLVLASLGLYALVAHTMMRRSREIAIRVALGATRHNVYALAARIVAPPVLIGLIVGNVGAVLLSRIFGSSFYGTGDIDLSMILLSTGILIVAVGAGTYIPAKRACRTDPMDAMRLA